MRLHSIECANPHRKHCETLCQNTTTHQHLQEGINWYVEDMWKTRFLPILSHLSVPRFSSLECPQPVTEEWRRSNWGEFEC
jgi:hypothetical protein